MYHRSGIIGICNGSDVIEKLISFIRTGKPEAPETDLLLT